MAVNTSDPHVFKTGNLKLFDDIENAEINFDDVIIAGRNEYYHDIKLEKVLERVKTLMLNLIKTN